MSDVSMTTRLPVQDYNMPFRLLTTNALSHIVDKEKGFQKEWLFSGFWFLHILSDPVTLQNKGAYSTGETQPKRKWTEARKKIIRSRAFFFSICAHLQ